METIVIHCDAVYWRLVVEEAAWIRAEHVTLVVPTNLTYGRSLSRSLSLVNLITLLTSSHSCDKVQQFFLINHIALLVFLLWCFFLSDLLVLLPHMLLLLLLIYSLFFHLFFSQTKLVLHIV
jgi:hypothetical protein